MRSPGDPDLRPGSNRCHPALDHDPGQGPDPDRHARLQGRRAEQGDRGQGLRQPRPDARGRRLPQHLPGREHVRHQPGLSRRWGSGQPDRDLLGVHGLQVPLPHGQRRHGLFRRHAQPDEGPDGARGASGRARHARRHVVALGHRLRRSRSRPRRRREVSRPAAGLRRAGPGGRILRRPRAHDSRSDPRTVLHRKGRPEVDRRAHQEVLQDLPLHAGSGGNEHRGSPHRQVHASRRRRRLRRPCSST